MNHRILIIVFALTCFFTQSIAKTSQREMLFDNNWKFFLGDVKGGEKPSLNDKTWRNIDLPHDWSIEKLAGQEADKVIGPFSNESKGTTATGYTVGGIAWYRKTLNQPPHFQRLACLLLCFCLF